MMASACKLACAAVMLLAPFGAGFVASHAVNVPAALSVGLIGAAIGWAGFVGFSALDRQEG